MSGTPARRGWLIGIGALLVVAIAATTLVIVLRDRDNQAAPPAELTVWQRIQSSADSNGVMPREPALQAFAYLFGDLPGVRMPAGRPDPPDFSISGSGAVRGVLAHWPELTDEQRSAVGRLIAAAEPPRLAAPGLLDLAPARQPNPQDAVQGPIVEEVMQLKETIGQRLGLTIPNPSVHLVDVEDDVPNVRAWSLALPEGATVDPNGFNFNGGNGPAHECRIYLPPSQWNPTGGSISQGLRQVLAHELMHCYQGFTYPSINRYNAAPGWILDGSADFGASVIAEAAPQGSWRIYLALQLPLFQQGYGAMGWWFHLDHLTHDPWRVFPTIWKGAQDSPTAYRTAGGNSEDVSDTWASSFLRNPGFGAAWNVHGLTVPGDLPPRASVDATAANVPANPYSATVAQVNVSRTGGTDSDVIVQLAANSPVRLHDSGGFEHVRASRGLYCVGSKCVCPEKTKRAGQEIQKVAAPLFLAVPGEESGNRAWTRTMGLREYCEDDDEDEDDIHEWKGGSNGDPHLTNFDGRVFDFQAGGEVTLARSNSGDLEIQARQEPLRLNGKENLAVSVNTAVAARVGRDRVGIYPTQEGLRVRINGEQPTELAEARTLPSGGSVRPREGDYEIRWPDGSALRVIPIGEYGLNLLISPADNLMRTVHGLLGPYEGVVNNPAMEDRTGKRYDTPTDDQLYEEIGESWRIKQADSLFDYEGGQSTDTFTRRDMPADPVELSARQRREAEAACAAVTDSKLREQCVFDVAVTGDRSFVDSYLSVQRINKRGGLRDGATVSGDIAKADEVDGYEVELAAGQEFRLADEPGDIQFSLVGKDESTEHVTFGTIAGLTLSAFRVSAAGTYQLRVSKTFGGTGKYGFRFVLLQQRRTEVKIGQKVTTHLDQPGRVEVYEFDAGDAEAIKVVSEPCGDIWIGVEENRPALDPGSNPACLGGAPTVWTVEPGKRYALVVWSDAAKVEDFTFRIERT